MPVTRAGFAVLEVTVPTTIAGIGARAAIRVVDVLRQVAVTGAVAIAVELTSTSDVTADLRGARGIRTLTRAAGTLAIRRTGRAVGEITIPATVTRVSPGTTIRVIDVVRDVAARTFTASTDRTIEGTGVTDPCRTTRIATFAQAAGTLPVTRAGFTVFEVAVATAVTGVDPRTAIRVVDVLRQVPITTAVAVTVELTVTGHRTAHPCRTRSISTFAHAADTVGICRTRRAVIAETTTGPRGTITDTVLSLIHI